jgi:hypothetical protein
VGYLCPVCGYPNLTELPRSHDSGGSYEICPSCGFEFGVSDDDLGYTFQRWRQEWVQRGMPWSSIGIPPPPDWDPVTQLRSAARNAG